MFSMNRLSTERRGQIVACLTEGMSMRATSRIVGVARNTVDKLLGDLGAVCADFQDSTFRHLPSQRFECDEIWSFVGAKERHVTEDHPDDYGDVWTWVAIDADTKLVPSWLVGERTAHDCYLFLADLKSRLGPGRVQITTDGLNSYLQVIEPLFGADRVDFAQLVKMYENTDDERRYSPARCSGIDKRTVTGRPDPRLISTSYVERQNLTLSMSMRRFTRLTNAFSKKLENHAASVALHFMHYNFGRPHQTLGKRITPAMAAGRADHPWSVWEIAGLLD